MGLSAFIVGLLLVISFATRIGSVQREVDALVSADRDQGLWAATQIQVELLEFQRLVQTAKFLPKAFEDDVRTDFDIVYSRMSQVMDPNLASVFRAEDDASSIPDDMIALRDGMAEIVDTSDSLELRELNELLSLAAEANDLWKQSIGLVLQETREYKISVRQRAAETLRSVKQVLWVAIATAVALPVLVIVMLLFRAQYRKTRRHTLIDTLTGCASRLGLQEALSGTFRRLNGGFSVAVADVNNLKEINDQYGHQAGDLVIQSVGIALRKITRGIDCPARIGGDEFIILLDASPEQSELILRRAQEFLEQMSETEDFGILPMQISFGVAQCDDPATFDDALSLADQRMYRQKTAEKARQTSFSTASIKG